MSKQPLQDSIKAFQNDFLPNVPEATMSVVMSEQNTLMNNGIAESAIDIGSRFPDFCLANAHNEMHNLDEFLASGPVVISFYRGAWCPYCNLEIKALQDSLPEIEATGARLIAITPQTPDKSDDQVTKDTLTFEVLSDIGNRLAKQCGLVFTLPEKLRPIYAAWQIDIPDHNGDDSFELPIPATYILDRDGIIRYAFVNMDYTQRLEPLVIIEQLSQL